MSEDPNYCISSRRKQAHNVPNLIVIDGSVFNASTSGNPTLMILALAIFQADHIAQHLKQETL